MRLLWTLPYLPWPTTSGGKTRQYNLLRQLAARGHRITLLVQSKTPLDDATRDALEPWLERLIVVPRRPLRSPRTLINVLFARPPMLASINGFSPDLEATFARLLQETWDIIQIEHSYGFQPFDAPLRQSGKPFILTEHNVESGLGAASYDRLPRWAAPSARYDQWRYRRWEHYVLARARPLIAVTDADALAMSQLTGHPAEVVVNGVDCDYFAQVQPAPDSCRLLFIGNYEYAPNVDAVEWAMEEIVPRLWQRCPDVRIAICGHALPPGWAQRWPDPRIEWQGFVPDLRELQKRTAIFFAPLRHGGGSKLKVLEAMAAGLAVVTTGQGVSGLAVENGHEYLGAESAEQLAGLLAEAIEQPERLARLGDAARLYVRRCHDWSACAAHLERLYMRRSHTKEDNRVCA